MKKLIVMALLAAPLSLFAQKFGHVNVEEIIPLMPEYAKAQTELQNTQKEYEDELVYMQEELEKKNAEYQAQAKSLPESTRQRREQELQDIYSKIEQFYADSREKLDKLTAELLQALENKVIEAIKSIGDAGGYTYIFSNSGQIPYIGKGSVDVTQQVKDKLGIK